MTNDSWPWDMFPEDTSTWEQCLKERTELLLRLERYEKALEFYADPDNWCGDGPDSEERGYYWCSRFMPEDQDYSNESGSVMVAGEQARTALAKIKEK